jgi:DNA-binding CsgD family transcriptional regulator
MMVMAAGLTPREHEIAELASLVLSNKQIAQTLGLAEETIKQHLYNDSKARYS